MTAASGLEVDDATAADRAWASLSASGAAYLALSLLVWWNVWSSHPTSTTICGCGDPSLFTWFLAWPAYAISHGLNPLYSTAMFHPSGVNLVANTAVLGIGVPLAPVTWIFGPVATLNVALTISPVLSALAMFILLRRWVSWQPAAFVGGLLYGFSPFVLLSLSNAHLMLGLQVVPPLVVACLDELLVHQRRRPAMVGGLLGLLMAVQFFIGTEILTILVISAGIGIALMAGYGVRHREVLRQRARYAAVALATAALVSLILLAYPAWFALAGPAHYSGSIWPASIIGRGGTTWRNYALPLGSSPALVGLEDRIGGYLGPFLSDQYFGLGLIVVVVSGVMAWFRDRRLWLFGAIGLVSVVLSLGLENTFWVPWRVLVRVPLVQNIIPVRFVAVTYFVAAVMLGIIVDHAHVTVNRWRLTRPRPSATSSDGPRRGAGAVAGAVVSIIALVPLAGYLAQTTPMTTRPVVLPSWFANVAPHLPGTPVILTFPVPTSPLQSAMIWQAVDGMHYAIVGGGRPASSITPAGVERNGQDILTSLSGVFSSIVITPDQILQLRRALVQWGVTMVVLPDPSHPPAYERVPSLRLIALAMAAVIGRRPTYAAGSWVWAGVNHASSSPIPTGARLDDCAAGKASSGDAAVNEATRCVVTAG